MVIEIDKTIEDIVKIMHEFFHYLHISKYEDIGKLCYENSNYLLMELPFISGVFERSDASVRKKISTIALGNSLMLSMRSPFKEDIRLQNL